MMRDNFLKGLFELAKKDKSVFLITGDLGFKIFDQYIENFKDRFLNVGVAEQNMIGVATGMALRGYKVVVYSIANFATLRCLEQIRNDAAYHNANITVVASGGGYTYGALGMSHHATEDIAVIRSLPDIKVFVPSSGLESYITTKKIINLNGVKYLRIEKESKYKPIQKRINISQGVYYNYGKDGVILTSGGILSECMQAEKSLNKKKLFFDVISINTIKPLSNLLLKKISKKKYIITVEEHNFSGGIGSCILEKLNELQIKKNIKIISIKDRYSSVVGDQQFMRKKNGIDSKSIENKILNFVKNK
jgi:transketolase